MKKLLLGILLAAYVAAGLLMAENVKVINPPNQPVPVYGIVRVVIVTPTPSATNSPTPTPTSTATP